MLVLTLKSILLLLIPFYIHFWFHLEDSTKHSHLLLSSRALLASPTGLGPMENRLTVGDDSKHFRVELGYPTIRMASPGNGTA